MKFFEAQKLARRNTTLLVVVFTLGSLVLSWLNAVIFQFVFSLSAKRNPWQNSLFEPIDYFFNPTVNKILVFSFIAFLVITWLFILKIPKPTELAVSLGGRLLEKPENPDELKLANVVEEMSIASGVIIPKIYILQNSQGINAFAAGTDPKNMVIGVTQGAISKLSRDELQGVIAHEFSHILNEDMKLNLTVSGVVMTFYMAKRFGMQILRSRSRSTSSKGSGQVFVIGIIFVIFGSVGHFFGRILQSLISKQREYLADASSAQFTRHPRSLASALGKIELGAGSIIDSPPFIEFAHIFFAHGFAESWGNLFATHPPLRSRIKSLLPTENTDSFLIEIGNQLYIEAKEATPVPTPTKIEINNSNLRRALDLIGNPDDTNFTISQTLISSTSELRKYLREVEIAKFTFALISLRSQKDGKDYLQELRSHLNNNEIYEKFQKFIFSEDDRYRSLLFYYSLDTLRKINEIEKEQMLNHMKDIFMRDQKMNLYEALLLLNAELVLRPLKISKQPSTNKKNEVLREITSLATNPESVNIEILFNFTAAFGKESLIKKKVLVEHLEQAFRLKGNHLNEEFRLLCMAINVPIPVI